MSDYNAKLFISWHKLINCEYCNHQSSKIHPYSSHELLLDLKIMATPPAVAAIAQPIRQSERISGIITAEASSAIDRPISEATLIIYLYIPSFSSISLILCS